MIIIKLIIILLYFSKSTQKHIENGVYNIISDNLYLNNYRNTLSINTRFYYPDTFFRLKKFYDNHEEECYIVETILSKLKLSYSNENDIIFTKETNNQQLWNFIKISDNNFIIKNQNNCYIILDNLNVDCKIISPYSATNFRLVKIFSETKYKKDDYKLLVNEPIDVLIKYIDLTDKNLIRNGIHQIEKDYDNEELRYSVRSILTNIPWIRKIFILMPNEKVRYFKDYNLIEEKIVYVKDKELLGYESSNSFAFQYRYWKMKKFGISDNIIVMDDDYFIGKKLKKKDFFHVVDGKVVPSIITSNFEKIDREFVKKNCEIYEPKAKYSKEEQNNDIFRYCKYLTYLFILDTFNISSNESIFLPKFTHNALPMNLNDIKDVYHLAYKSKYKFSTLNCLYRHYEYLQFQILVVSYIFIKYGRKVKNIPSDFIQLNDSISANFDFHLFCINKGAGNYPQINLYKEKIVMEYLFPNPTKYEIKDYSLTKLFINIIHTFEKKVKKYESDLSQMITKKEYYILAMIKYFLFFLLLFKVYLLFNNI